MITFTIHVLLESGPATVTVVPAETAEDEKLNFFEFSLNNQKSFAVRLNQESEWEIHCGHELKQEDLKKIISKIESSLFSVPGKIDLPDSSLLKLEQTENAMWFKDIVWRFWKD